MTEPDSTYWDSLGIAWCAINPRNNVIAQRLEARLRRQSFLISAGLVAGMTLTCAGLLLGLFTIWRGWETSSWNFVVRGVAIEVIAVILLVAVTRLLPVRAHDAARGMSQLLELSISRAQRTLQILRLGLYACGVAAISGIAGAAVRTYVAGPPKMSPVIDLAVLAIFAIGLLVYGRQVRDNLERLRSLRHALSVDDGSEQ